jgi:hypothetical protein
MDASRLKDIYSESPVIDATGLKNIYSGQNNFVNFLINCHS